MFRSSSARQSELAEARLAKHLNYWARTAATWFDGTPASVEERTATLDRIITFARDTVARLGSTSAGRHCVAALPELEQHRRELAVARGSLLNGFSDRQAGSLVPAGRRTASYRYADGGSLYDVALGPDSPLGKGLNAVGQGINNFGVGIGEALAQPGSHWDMNNGEQQGALIPGHAPATSGGIGKGDVTPAPANPSAGTGPLNPAPANPSAGTGPLNPAHTNPSAGTGPLANTPPKPTTPTPGLNTNTPPVGKSSALHRAIELGTREFLAAQNTDDHDELIFRARRYAEEQTSTLPMPTAHALAAAFVDRVEQRIAQRPRQQQ